MGLAFSGRTLSPDILNLTFLAFIFDVLLFVCLLYSTTMLSFNFKNYVTISLEAIDFSHFLLLVHHGKEDYHIERRSPVVHIVTIPGWMR